METVVQVSSNASNNTLNPMEFNSNRPSAWVDHTITFPNTTTITYGNGMVDKEKELETIKRSLTLSNFKENRLKTILEGFRNRHGHFGNCKNSTHDVRKCNDSCRGAKSFWGNRIIN